MENWRRKKGKSGLGSFIGESPSSILSFATSHGDLTLVAWKHLLRYAEKSLRFATVGSVLQIVFGEIFMNLSVGVNIVGFGHAMVFYFSVCSLRASRLRKLDYMFS